MEESLEGALFKIGLGTVYQRFREQKIDSDCVRKLSDEELAVLGVVTIGDRIRLRESLMHTSLSSGTDATSTASPAETSDTTEASSSGSTLIERIRRERSNLFSRRNGSGGHVNSKSKQRTQKKSINRTWTATFVCLADKSQEKIPTASEKEVLFKAGLGSKRIQFNVEDKEEDVVAKLSTNDTGFHQLQDIGGFELLRCRQNCKELEIINCPWTVLDMKATLGSQSKIYLRPIQTNLSTKSTLPSTPYNPKKEKCKGCGSSFNIHELRKHMKVCLHYKIDLEDILDSDESDLPDPGLGLNSSSPTTTVDVHESVDSNIYVSTQFIADTPADKNLSNVEVNIDANTAVENIISFLQENSEVSDSSGLHVHVESIVLSSEAQGSIGVSGDSATIPIEDVVLSAGTGHNLEEPRTDDVESGNLSADLVISTGNQDILALINNCIAYLVEESINDPVDILRYIQKQIVTGRDLEVSCIEITIEGETNFICIDRQNLLETSFEEIAALTDLRPTLEVQFYGENAVDNGGPRKEFFRLILREIKEKYFEPMRPFAKMEDYETIGRILALSMLQNGKIPQFLVSSFVTELFDSNTSSPSLIVKSLRKGLDSLGIYKIVSSLPQFQHLFRTKRPVLSLKSIITIMKPAFSEIGTNKRSRENKVYAAFTKYIREVSSGRREYVSLQDVLLFATGADEEPILGFALDPEITFSETSISFLTTANTCINRMNLPVPSHENELPSNDVLFNLYDYAFTNSYYGLS